LEDYEAVQGEIQALSNYYENGLWMQDLDDDRAGKLPPGLERGVLSEDAIYTLLTDRSRLQSLFRAMSQGNEGS
jgi:hypothetical protein